MQSLSFYFKKPKILLIGLVKRLNWMFPDKLYLKILFRLEMGYKLSLKNPRTFNEKIQWLKLYDRKPEYTKMVDKYEAKKYVAGIIGDEYIIPTLGVWNSFDEIDFDSLPNQFVLKTTHGGGGSGVVICKDKNNFDIEKCKAKIDISMKSNIYKTLREWPYKNVKPRIIAEEYITNGGDYINDYKLFCFNGEPKAILIANGRFVEPETYFDYFDMDFNHFPFRQGGPNYHSKIDIPPLFEEMKDVARKLSKDLPHARIDLYEYKGKLKFGEITFFDSSGFEKFEPEEWAVTFGDWIKLPNKISHEYIEKNKQV